MARRRIATGITTAAACGTRSRSPAAAVRRTAMTKIDPSPLVSPAERLAALGDLRTFLAMARERGELEVIRGADPELEMGALYELSLRDLYPRTLLFEQMRGLPPDRRVLMNVRFSRIFVGNLDLDAVRAHRARGRWESNPLPPVTVDDGPILENVIVGDAVDVT